MLSRYDATQAARVDCEFARKYDTTQAARVDCEFVRAYDDTEGAWVEKMFAKWLTLEDKSVSSVDTLSISPSKVYLDMPSRGSQDRQVEFECTDHDIQTGDAIEFDLSATYYASVYIGMTYYTTGSGWGTQTVYSKSAKTDEVNGHINVVLTEPSNFSEWDTLFVILSYDYENTVTSATAEISNLKISGKKYGFTE
mgnify:CR=1 FL=1